MSIVARSVVETSPSVTGSQTITIADLGGLVPTAASFDWVNVDDLRSARNIASIGFGFADASNQFCMITGSEHGLGTSDTGRRAYDTRCIAYADDADGSFLKHATFGSFATNSITLNWTVAEPTPDYLFVVTLYAGTSLTTKVGSVTVNSTQNGSFTISTGFETHGGIFGWARNQDDQSWLPNVDISKGYMSFDGTTIKQTCFAWRVDNGEATTDIELEVRNDRCCGSRNVEKFEITSVGASNVTLVTRDLASANRDIIYLLFGSDASETLPRFHTEIIDTPTASGTQSYTGFGFRPQLVQMIGTLAESINTDITITGQIGTIALCSNGNDQESSMTASDEDNVGTTNTQSYYDNKALVVPLEDGATGIVATHASFTVDGVDLTFSDVLGNAKKIPVFAIAEINEAPVVNNQAFSVDENSASDTVVGIVVATDANGDPITYTIFGGTGETAFSISSATGVITVLDPSQLDYEATDTLTLSVRTEDSFGASDTATITININDVAEGGAGAGAGLLHRKIGLPISLGL